MGATLSTKNDWSKEISIRINKAQKTFHALTNVFTSKMLSRKTKARLFATIIRSTLTYGCEAWTTTKQTERNLRIFEHRVWRKICRPVIDETTGNWRRRYNRKLYDLLELTPVTSFIKGQRIQWLGDIARRQNNEVVRVALEWKPHGKRPRGRLQKRWINVIEEDLKIIGVEDWRDTAQNRDRWRSVVLAAKTLRE